MKQSQEATDIMASVQLFVLLALLGVVAAAPWRCVGGCGSPTVCVGTQGRPCFNPPSIQYGQPGPPCTGPATVLTPCRPCPSPCPRPCCPCPCPSPCPCPCDPCSPPPCGCN